MKRILSILFIVLLFSTSAIAEGLDLSSMSYEQLVELKRAVDNEYYARPEAEPNVLAPGNYIVGEDIQAGTYYVCVNSYEFNQTANTWFRVYESRDAYDAGSEPLWYNYISLDEQASCVTLKNGNMVRIGDFPVTMSVRKLAENERYQYAIPDGTYVPCGTYKVGQEIPAGSYQVYMGSIYGGYMAIYPDDAAYKDRNDATYVELRVIWSDHTKSAVLEDGNVVVVHRDVVLRKQAELIFD